MHQLQTAPRMIGIVQSLVARYATAGSFRRRPAGTTQAARKFLAGMPLKPFATEDEGIFRKQTESATDGLQAKMPGHERGFARKALNVFLRDCLYNSYLRSEYRLELSGAFCEVPLDSIVAKELRKFDPCLPAWDAIKRLDPATSAKYQAAARRIARELGMSRVHLDALCWGARKSLRELGARVAWGLLFRPAQSDKRLVPMPCQRTDAVSLAWLLGAGNDSRIHKSSLHAEVYVVMDLGRRVAIHLGSWQHLAVSVCLDVLQDSQNQIHVAPHDWIVIRYEPDSYSGCCTQL